MSETKKYGLILPTKPTKGKAVISKASIFSNDDDDEETNTAIDRKSQGQQKESKVNLLLKRQTQLDVEKALQDDPTVYEYDSVYDDLHAKQEEKLATSKSDRKPKYIASLMKAAAQRKKELERRIEKTVQKEREAEKGEFEDKEAFVTDAYRRKMKEMQEEEERDRIKDEMEARMDVTKQSDLSSFYANILKQTTGEISETKHDPATVIKQEATENSSSLSTISKVPETKNLPFADDRDDSVDSSESSDSDSRSARNEERHSSRKSADKKSDSVDDRRVAEESRRPDRHEMNRKHGRSDDRRRSTERGIDTHRRHRDKHRSKGERDDRKHRSERDPGSSSSSHGNANDRHSDRRETDRTDRKYDKRHKEREKDGESSSKKNSDLSRQTDSPNGDKKNDKNSRNKNAKKVSADETVVHVLVNNETVPCDDDYSNSDESSDEEDEVQKSSRKRAAEKKTIPSVNPAALKADEPKFSKKTVGDSLDSARARFLARKKTLEVPVARGDDSD